MDAKTIISLALGIGAGIAMIVSINKHSRQIENGERGNDAYIIVFVLSLGAVASFLPRGLRMFVGKDAADLIGRLTAAVLFVWMGIRDMRALRIRRENEDKKWNK